MNSGGSWLYDTSHRTWDEEEESSLLVLLMKYLSFEACSLNPTVSIFHTLLGTLMRKHTFLGIIRQWAHNLAHTWNLTYCIYSAFSCAAYTVNISANDYWCLLYLRLPNIFNLIISFLFFMWSVFLKKYFVALNFLSVAFAPKWFSYILFLQCSFIHFWSGDGWKKKKKRKQKKMVST